MTAMALQIFGRGRPDQASAEAAQPAEELEEFAAVYRSLFVPAMRLAYRLTGSRETAEDVAAEALARAYARWREVAPMPHRDAWVMRVATNLALDTVRRRGPAQQAQRALERSYGDGLSTDAADALATRLALVAALRELPQRQRESIVLFYLAGLSEAEVSASLGITPSSVRTHIQRGLGRLRTHLRPEPEELLRG